MVPAQVDVTDDDEPVIRERKRRLGMSVLEAAERRIADVFDSFPHVYLSGPSGKDSSVMMHLVCLEARRRGRRVGVLYLDLEAQYALTIAHVREMFELYADVIEPHWVALSIHLRNAVSMHQPYWISWDPECRDAWVREPDPRAVTDPTAYPFYRAPWGQGGTRWAMEFEEFIADFGNWYGGGEATACLVGIRSAESLNRWRAISGDHHRFGGRKWTTWKGRAVYNAYPIYDWSTEDVWTFFGRTALPSPRIYDLMYRAGVPLSQMRICQPYGDDQRRGLWLYHVLEPVTWSRVVARVAGARSGALYANKSGNIQGNRIIELPPSHATWESFARFLLDTMPAAEAEHYRTKITAFLGWYSTRGYPGGLIPDEIDAHAEAQRKGPSWRRIAKTILKNDRLCKGLGFSQTNSAYYEKYRKIMRKRASQWRIYL